MLQIPWGLSVGTGSQVNGSFLALTIEGFTGSTNVWTIEELIA